jgi:hypothetical protein
MSINVSIGFQIPTNVVEVGNEITSDQLGAIGAASTPSAANPFVTQSALPAAGVTVDKATANAIATSLWYVYDTGTDYNKTGGPVNVQLIAGYGTSGVTDGTTFVTGFPSVITSLSPNQYWWVSVNGTLSDFIVSDAAP